MEEPEIASATIKLLVAFTALGNMMEQVAKHPTPPDSEDLLKIFAQLLQCLSAMNSKMVEQESRIAMLERINKLGPKAVHRKERIPEHGRS